MQNLVEIVTVKAKLVHEDEWQEIISTCPVTGEKIEITYDPRRDPHSIDLSKLNLAVACIGCAGTPEVVLVETPDLNTVKVGSKFKGEFTILCHRPANSTTPNNSNG